MKKSISAEIIADSKNEFGQRITTFILTFPRIILAELNTHRMFSRNSASSRAIPFKKMLEMVTEDPFIPIAFQKDHSGMQGKEYFTGWKVKLIVKGWLFARDMAVKAALILNRIGLTKQLCNRLLEPFMWHTAIVTATEYENFFHLRCPQYEYKKEDGKIINFRSKEEYLDCELRYTGVARDIFSRSNLNWHKINRGAGEIHIMALAEAMWDAINESKPKQLKSGEWHIPFFNDTQGKDERVWDILKNTSNPQNKEKYLKEYWAVIRKIATARCARVSYLNFEGKDDYETDIRLHDRLSNMGHWSPFEHCARVMEDEIFLTQHKSNQWSGNFKGFIQYRKLFSNENITS